MLVCVSSKQLLPTIEVIIFKNPGPDEPVATAMAGSNTSISLSWSAPSGSVVTSYQVEWSSNQCPDDLVQKEVDVSTATSYSIPGLRPGTSYNVSVSAINSAGATSSNTVTLATQEAGI